MPQRNVKWIIISLMCVMYIIICLFAIYFKENRHFPKHEKDETPFYYYYNLDLSKETLTLDTVTCHLNRGRPKLLLGFNKPVRDTDVYIDSIKTKVAASNKGIELLLLTGNASYVFKNYAIRHYEAQAFDSLLNLEGSIHFGVLIDSTGRVKFYTKNVGLDVALLDKLLEGV